MSDRAYLDERLRAIDRDNTFRMGQLALQVKNDIAGIRKRLDDLEQRAQRLEQEIFAQQQSTQVN